MTTLTEELRTTTIERLGASATAADLETYLKALRASWPVGPDAELDDDLAEIYTTASLEGRESKIGTASLALQSVRLAKLLTGSAPLDGPHAPSTLTPSETRAALSFLAQSIREAVWAPGLRAAARALADRAQAAAGSESDLLEGQRGLAARGLLHARR